MDESLLGGPAILLLIATPSCLAIGPTAYYDLATAEKNFKFEAESLGGSGQFYDLPTPTPQPGGQFYDLPQLKDFGLTKTPGRHRQNLLPKCIQ